MAIQQSNLVSGNANIISKIIGGVLILYLLSYFFTPFVYQQCSTSTQQNIYWLIHNNSSYTVIFVLFITISVIWYVKSLKTSKSNATKLIKTLFVIVVLVLALGIYWIAAFPDSGIGGGTAHIANFVNRRRNYDVRDISVALTQYYEKNNKYPTDLTQLVPTYIQKIPTDPVTNQSYEYAISAKAKDYVVKADFNNFAPGCYSQVTLAPLSRKLQGIDLNYDLDGTVYGVDCNDPAYCKGPEQFQ